MATLAFASAVVGALDVVSEVPVEVGTETPPWADPLDVGEAEAAVVDFAVVLCDAVSCGVTPWGAMLEAAGLPGGATADADPIGAPDPPDGWTAVSAVGTVAVDVPAFEWLVQPDETTRTRMVPVTHLRA